MQRFPRGTECDEAVRHELRAAGIDPVCGEPAVGEVISSVTGRLGDFTFRRAWCHWVADGLVPLEVALAMHADPAARKGLRVGGHHARPAPGQFATVWLDGEGNLNLPLGDKEETAEALAVHTPRRTGGSSAGPGWSSSPTRRAAAAGLWTVITSTPTTGSFCSPRRCAATGWGEAPSPGRCGAPGPGPTCG